MRMTMKAMATGSLAALVAAPALVFASEPATPKFQLPLDAPAPVFQLRMIDGTKIRLDEIAYSGHEKRYAKKRPLLLDFFRTDCGPCRASMPELVEAYQNYHARGLEVVLVALVEPEDGIAKLEKYLAANPLPFTVVVDENETYSKKYLGNPVSLPATFLIDREGVLRASRYGAKGTLKATFGDGIAKLLSGGEGGAVAIPASAVSPGPATPPGQGGR
jgi:thiol-disulfide isomerase/thioredoxin